MFDYPICLITRFVQFLLATLLLRHTIAGAAAQPQPGQITCTGLFSPLSPQSCLDAIKQIPDTDDPLRSANSRFFLLPQRISSSDGRCVIHVGPGRQPRQFEIITGKRLRHLVIQVFRQCLVGQGRMGVIYEKGRAGKFYVLLEQFNPSGISCVDRSPDPAPSDCRGAIETISWVTGTRRFREGPPQHPTDVQLPVLFVGVPRVQSTCMIILDTTGDDEGTWYLIWSTAVAIDAMCVRRGLMGWRSHLGLSFSTHPQASPLDSTVKVHRERVFAYHSAIGNMGRLSLIVDSPRPRGVAVS